jgi:ribosomal protein S18 acetylase RimI-like enzyme
MSPSIRPFHPKDWPALCRVHDAARMQELSANKLEAAFLDLEQTVASEGLFEGLLRVAADEHGKVLGFAAWAQGDTEAELTWLYVDPAMQRRGVGRALLRAAIEASGGAMHTEALAGNERAIQLYLSEGFVIEKRVDGQLTGNEGYAASGYVLVRKPN